MRKLIIQILLIVITLLAVINSHIIINSINEAINLFFYSVFPSLFPFFILSYFIISYDVIDLFSLIVNKVISKLFNISKYSSIVFILSLISGFPSNAKNIEILLKNKIISLNEATKILTISFFPNPMFLIGIIGYKFYNNITVGILLIMSFILTNIILGIITRNKIKIEIENYRTGKKSNPLFFKILNDSVISSFKSLIIIFGSISTFTFIINILFNYVEFSPFIKSLISGLLEITNGLSQISILNISLTAKVLLSSTIIYISGLCVISQVVSILNEYSINYKHVLTYKVLGLFINVTITVLLSFLFL